MRQCDASTLAFILCVVPLATALSGSMNSQRAIGTGVLGGMIMATVLAVFVAPLYSVLIAWAFQSRRKDEARAAPASPATPPIPASSCPGNDFLKFRASPDRRRTTAPSRGRR